MASACAEQTEGKDIDEISVAVPSYFPSECRLAHSLILVQRARGISVNFRSSFRMQRLL
jgi:hypothetical protein